MITAAGRAGRRSFRLEGSGTGVGEGPPPHSIVGPGVLAATFALLLSLAGAPAHLDTLGPGGTRREPALLAHRTAVARGADRRPVDAGAVDHRRRR